MLIACFGHRKHPVQPYVGIDPKTRAEKGESWGECDVDGLRL